MPELFLSLGSNLGDRAANLHKAETLLEERLHTPVLRRSRILETEAVGFVGPDFLNSILVFESSEDPLAILGKCKEIERLMGRSDAPEYDAAGARVYHNRIIDIDILRYGECSISTAELTIPHPAIGSRAFLKELLSDVSVLPEDTALEVDA